MLMCKKICVIQTTSQLFCLDIFVRSDEIFLTNLNEIFLIGRTWVSPSRLDIFKSRKPYSSFSFLLSDYKKVNDVAEYSVNIHISSQVSLKWQISGPLTDHKILTSHQLYWNEQKSKQNSLLARCYFYYAKLRLKYFEEFARTFFDQPMIKLKFSVCT